MSAENKKHDRDTLQSRKRVAGEAMVIDQQVETINQRKKTDLKPNKINRDQKL